MSNLSTEMLQQALQQLISDGYVVEKDGKYVVSEKGIALVKEVHHALVEKPKNNTLQVIKMQQDWMLAFINFIQEAKIPKYCDNGKGQEYIVNNYSDPAMKVFKKAIEKEGVVYDVLVKSTMLYYKSTKNKFKKAVGNYFVQGDWRSDYNALLDAAGTGTVESLIKSEMDNGASRFELG